MPTNDRIVAGDTLGIVAGGGELPLAIAQAAAADGRAVFIVGLEGMAAAQDIGDFPHAFASIGEFGKVIKLLKDAHCSEVTMAGQVPRPQFNAMKVDARAALALPRIIAAARKGDDALLRLVLSLFEKEGFRVIGSADAAHDLLAPAGPLGDLEPTEDEAADIARAVHVVRALGALDIGQAAVVCQGVVLAVEAAEGTDAMLRRVAGLPQALRGTNDDPRGVLVKAVKPAQERRVDLPVIGARTVELVAQAGLAGIAVEAGAALIVNRRAIAEAADTAGIFLYGFMPGEYPE